MALIESRLDTVSLDRYLSEHDLSREGTALERAKRLARYYVETAPAELVECECGGVSAGWEAMCPFCGDATPVHEEADEPADEPEEPGTESELTPAAVVPALNWESVLEAVRAAAARGAEAIYDLGLLIRRVHDEELWRLKRGTDGEPLYRTFKQAVQREFGIGHTYAHELIAVVRRFDRSAVRQLGATKLALTLKAPPDKQEEMADAAKRGASKRDLKRKLAELKGRPAPVDTRKVTVALMDNRIVVPAFAVPSASNPRKLAKAWGDGVWAEIPLANEVQLTVKLTREADGKLVLVLDARRIAADGQLL